MGKRIELCKKKAGDLKTGFGNPRKITRKKLEELETSFDLFGDFGIFLIDEQDNVIAGNQRLKVVLRKYGPDQEIDCKRLIGYSQAELRSINLRDNTHSGTWDEDILAEWTADLFIDPGIDPKEKKKHPDEMTLPDMELLRYEGYNYVLIVCDNEIDYKDLQNALGLKGRKMIVSEKRKIQARAVWYNDMKAQIVPKRNLAAVDQEDTEDQEDMEEEDYEGSDNRVQQNEEECGSGAEE